jgi:hypothetical protein
MSCEEKKRLASGYESATTKFSLAVAEGSAEEWAPQVKRNINDLTGPPMKRASVPNTLDLRLSSTSPLMVARRTGESSFQGFCLEELRP